jgi:hypothetical protein
LSCIWFNASICLDLNHSGVSDFLLGKQNHGKEGKKQRIRCLIQHGKQRFRRSRVSDIVKWVECCSTIFKRLYFSIRHSKT